MKHTEYIVPIGEDAQDYDEMFIGVIRRQPVLIRCKDCKWRMRTKNRHDNKERIYCELFFDPTEHHYYRCKDGDFCSRAERRKDDRRQNNTV